MKNIMAIFCHSFRGTRNAQSSSIEIRRSTLEINAVSCSPARISLASQPKSALRPTKSRPISTGRASGSTSRSHLGSVARTLLTSSASMTATISKSLQTLMKALRGRRYRQGSCQEQAQVATPPCWSTKYRQCSSARKTPGRPA